MTGIWWRQEYQLSGQPCARMTSGPFPASATRSLMPLVSTIRKWTPSTGLGVVAAWVAHAATINAVAATAPPHSHAVSPRAKPIICALPRAGVRLGAGRPFHCLPPTASCRRETLLRYGMTAPNQSANPANNDHVGAEA